jgi:hypothetical protein
MPFLIVQPDPVTNDSIISMGPGSIGRISMGPGSIGRNVFPPFNETWPD